MLFRLFTFLVLLSIPLEAATTIEKITKAGNINKPVKEGDVQPIIKTDDKDEIARIQNYINSIRTLKADFLQVMSDGSVETGKIAISRPGKMRLEYDAPNDNLLVADGALVHVWDGAAKTSSSVPLGTSLADIILRDELKFEGDITITEIKQYPAAIQVTLVQSANPEAGSMTLEFEDRPLKLRNWRVLDAQGYETRVAISNERVDVDIPSSTFFYRDPSIGRSKGR